MRASIGRKYWAAILVTLGVAFAAAGLMFWFAWGFAETRAYNQLVFGIVVHVLFGYIVVMSGIIIYRSDLAVDECFVAGKWCFGGFLFMSVLVIWADAPQLADSGMRVETLYRLVVVGSVGAAGGVLIGLNRGQAIQNRRLVDEKAERENTLVFLHRLLRHDILNDLTAISGHAQLLEETTDAEDTEPIEQIQTRTDSTKRLLETAGTIIESETAESELEPINVTASLRERAADVQSEHPEVEVETDVADDLTVSADHLVDDLFQNLLENALAHNDTTDLTVFVSAKDSGDEVVVRIVDDGTGIPESIRDDVFDPGVQREGSKGDGLGLYLVRKLVESYDGSIHLDSTDSNGTAFTLRFPAV